ncbi:MAG TPA: hypothetical protein VF132_00230 [Rudaea sp.]
MTMQRYRASARVLCAFVAPVLALAFLAPTLAFAICLPTVHYLYVGNKNTDPQCDAGSIQEAISEVVCPGTVIVLTPQISYSAQAITIDKSVAITGSTNGCGMQASGFAPTAACEGKSCSSNLAAAGPRTVIDGSGNGGASVISIVSPAAVTLNNLEITGGATPGNGGGINDASSGNLTLNNVFVHDNTAAGSGGGIWIVPASGSPDIVFNPYVAIYSNSAVSFGAGVHLGGHAYLHMTAPQTTIAYNDAGSNGYGGGLHVESSARADIASSGLRPGLFGQGVTHAFQNNMAREGGALEIGAQTVRIYSIDAAAPTTLAFNSASDMGGVVLMGGTEDVNHNPIYSNLCLQDVNLLGNSAAADGGVIFASYSSRVAFNADPHGVCGFAALPSAQHCASSVNCNAATANTSAGQMFRFVDRAEFVADRIMIRGNTASTMIENSYFGLLTKLSNCLIAENAVTTSLLTFEVQDLSIDGCTIAHNHIAGDAVIDAYLGEDTFGVTNSIVYEPGKPMVVNTGTSVYATLTYAYLLVNSDSGMSGPSIATGDPLFADAVDYHLQATSPAIDFAPAAARGAIDLDADPRTVDLSTVPNRSGPRDLGAYEYQVGNVHDRIFMDGFQPP